MAEPGDGRWRGDTRSLVQAVHSVASGDPADLPGRLCRTLATALGVDGAAMATMTETPLRHRLGSSDDLADCLETVQFTTGEGPCVEAAATGHPVIVEDLHAEAECRWPGFADLAARHLGEIRSVFGFALRLDGVTFGSLNLYSRTRCGLSPDEITDVTRAVTVATAALLAGYRSRDASATEESVEESPAAPITADPWRAMHVAVGITAELLNITPSEALARMRAHALSHDLLLSEVAAQILTDRLGPAE